MAKIISPVTLGQGELWCGSRPCRARSGVEAWEALDGMLTRCGEVVSTTYPRAARRDPVSLIMVTPSYTVRQRRNALMSSKQKKQMESVPESRPFWVSFDFHDRNGCSGQVQCSGGPTGDTAVKWRCGPRAVGVVGECLPQYLAYTVSCH